MFAVSCEFRMEDEDARKEIASTTPIQFHHHIVEDQTIHYALVDQQKEFMLVFLHGSPGSWNAFIHYFSNDSLLVHFDMISLDRPGFGTSNFGIAEPSLAEQARQLHDALIKFPQKKILIGHSLGGPVAVRMVMDYPGAYQSMLLVAPSVDPELEENEWYRGFISTTLGGWLTPKEFEVSNEEILPLKEELTEMLDFWDKVDIPTTVLHGTADRLVPVENVDFIQKQLPDSLLTIIILEDVNHFIPWNNPIEMTKAIQQLTLKDGQ